MNTPMTLEQALAEMHDYAFHGTVEVLADIQRWHDAIVALAALGEAVGYATQDGGVIWYSEDGWSKQPKPGTDLYTQPPAPQVDYAMKRRAARAFCQKMAEYGHKLDGIATTDAINCAIQAALEVPNV